jgi:hypothetical protein
VLKRELYGGDRAEAIAEIRGWPSIRRFDCRSTFCNTEKITASTTIRGAAGIRLFA